MFCYYYSSSLNCFLPDIYLAYPNSLPSADRPILCVELLLGVWLIWFWLAVSEFKNGFSCTTFFGETGFGIVYCPPISPNDIWDLSASS